MVKADAYGLGMAEVAPALARAGCKTFFVATLGEANELRALLPEAIAERGVVGEFLDGVGKGLRVAGLGDHARIGLDDQARVVAVGIERGDDRAPRQLGRHGGL